MQTLYSREELEKLLVDEAIHALTEKPVKTTTIERVKLFNKADAALPADMPQPLKYGHGLKYVLERVSTPIEPHDLILGRVTEEVPGEEDEAFFQEVIARFGRWPGAKSSTPNWVFDGGHTSFYWKEVIRQGLSGLKRKAEERLNRAARDGEPQKVVDYLTGAVMVYGALQTYLFRYARAARDKGLHEAAEACEHAATRAPETFREALQMLWGIMVVYCSYLAVNPTLTYGRMDLFLQPLYERDLAEGRLTREEAGLLILDFYAKNNLNMGRGEHQLSGEDERVSTGWERNLNYDAPQYLVLAGSRPEGGSAVSDLTLLFAEQVVPRFKNPVIVVRYAPDMMKAHAVVWRTLVNKMRDSASMMVYNERDIIAAYIKSGADEQDARQFEHFGCNWPTLPGMDGGGCWHMQLWCDDITDAEREQLKPGVDWQIRPGGITQLFMDALYELADRDDATIDDFYSRLGAGYGAFMRKKLRRALTEREILFRQRPGILLMQDCFFRETIERGADYLTGGCRYYAVENSFGGFATLVDCLSAVDTLVFRDQALTLRELCDAVKDNFKRRPDIRALCQNAPKLGSDDRFANAHGARALNTLTDAVYQVAEEFRWADTAENRIIIRESIETDTSHIRMGASLGATPDGRLAGEPLSQNCQPSVGASTKGLTAMLRSMASLPFDRIMSGAQNISILPRLFQGAAGLSLLSSILGTYFELGGLQTQISAVDVEELLDAQINPDAHRDLMVRVTGYSAVFVDMIKSAQDDVIRRELLGA